MQYESLFEQKNLILFDTSWVAHASLVAKAYSWMSYKGKFSGHIFGSLSKILSALKIYGKNSKTDLIFVFDEYPEETYKIYPEYKDGRVKIYDPITDVKAMIQLFDCQYASASKTEADHVIATIAAQHCNSYKIYIVSADKDLWQLLDLPNVDITPRPKEYATLSKFEEKFGIKNVSGLALQKAIFGDPSDNIPKLKGILQHKPIKRLIDASNGTPDHFYSFLKKRPKDMRQSVFDLLLNNKDWVKKMYSITLLRTDVPYKMTNNPKNTKDLGKLIEFLHSFGIRSFDSKIDILFEKV